MNAVARPLGFSCAVFLTFLLASSSGAVASASARDASARTPSPTAFLVDETSAGDLNGDGDSLDFVLHVYDARQRVTLNIGLAAATVCRGILGPPFRLCQPVSPVIGRTIVAFAVNEDAQGGADLNGDGDAGDDVLYAYDMKSGAITNTELALAHGIGRDTSSYTFPISPVVAGDAVVFLVAEREQSESDLNGDGDAEDVVFHVLDSKNTEIVNLGVAAATIFGPFGSHNPIPPESNGHTVVLSIGEPEQGATDLNGDGDADDQVTYVLKTQSGKLRLAR